MWWIHEGWTWTSFPCPSTVCVYVCVWVIAGPLSRPCVEGQTDDSDLLLDVFLQKTKLPFFSIHTQNNRHLNQTATAQSQRSRRTGTAGWFDPARQLTAKITMLNVSLGFCSSVSQSSSQSNSIVGVLYFTTFHRCVQKPENACEDVSIGTRQ